MDVDDPMGISYPYFPKVLRVAWHRAFEAIATGDDDALRSTLVDHPDLATDLVISGHLMRDAVEHGRVGTVAVLLEAGFPTDERGDSNETVLIDAAWHGYADVVRLLLEAGADPDLAAEEDGDYGDPQASGRCALWAAIYRGDREVIDVLEPATCQEMRMRAYEAASRGCYEL